MKKKTTIEHFAETFMMIMPKENEINDIEALVKEIYEKKYKKIIFYALGTSYHTINLLYQFYSFHNKNFDIELCNDDDHDTKLHLINEINNGALIIFCSRTGNTHEIIHQLRNIIEQENFHEIKKNILIITNCTTNNKTNIIARNNDLCVVNIKNGYTAGRFEFFNSIFFFMIELMKPENDLLAIKTMLSQEGLFENILNDTREFVHDDLLKSLISPNHAIIIYSNNHILNKVLTWLKHLWYESFGKIKINVYFEDYSSLFHSSIQYYLNHPEDYYYIIKLSSDNSQNANFNDHFKIYLQNSFLVDIKMSNDVKDLVKGIVKIIGILIHLSEELEIDILNQEYVDQYKKNLLERLL